MIPEPARRRDAGILQTTERDMITLTWIAEQYCICFDHLRSLLAYYSPVSIQNPERVAISTARNAVERWLQMGYIETPQKIIREQCTSIWLSRKGLKELGLPYAYYQPKPSTIRHLYAVNTIRLTMQRYTLSAHWTAQRTLRLQTDHHPIPDAILQTQHASFSPVQLGIQILEPQYIPPITIQPMSLAQPIQARATAITLLHTFRE
jgi:hypothetical protein